MSPRRFGCRCHDARVGWVKVMKRQKYAVIVVAEGRLL